MEQQDDPELRASEEVEDVDIFDAPPAFTREEREAMNQEDGDA